MDKEELINLLSGKLEIEYGPMTSLIRSAENWYRERKQKCENIQSEQDSGNVPMD